MISHNSFLNIAQEIAETSNCVSLKVGCVIVKDQRIISTGYNGTPAGYINCGDLFSERCDAHRLWSINHEIHAEMNAIIFAAKCGIPIDAADLYTTISPCNNCLKHMKQSGIKNVFYRDKYYRMSDEEHDKNKFFCDDLGLGYFHIKNA